MASNSKDLLQEIAPLALTFGGIWLGFRSGLIPALINATTVGLGHVGAATNSVSGAQHPQALALTGAPAGAGQPAAATCAGWTRQLSAAELAATGMAPGHTVADLFNAQYGANGFNQWRAQGGQC
jgi:hypothetical protein